MSEQMNFHQHYVSPFAERYRRSSCYVWSDQFKVQTYRKIWTKLAKAQKAAGVKIITDKAILSMESAIHEYNPQRIEELEAVTQHDIQANIQAFGELAPEARDIIHLGCTSAFVVDNYYLIAMRKSLEVIKYRLILLIHKYYNMAKHYKYDLCLAYTHGQVAQITTIGKRLASWLQDLIEDLEYIDFITPKIKMLGCRGPIGSASTMMQVVGFDKDKVIKIEQHMVEALGFESVYDISTQTYPRKINSQVFTALSNIAETASKISIDIRLLSSLGDATEVHGKGYIGSSAMPHKVNPIISEKVTSLSRFVIIQAQAQSFTTSNQWLERSLDDSAISRLIIPETFMATIEVLISLEEMTLKFKNFDTQCADEEFITLFSDNVVTEGILRGLKRHDVYKIIQEYLSTHKHLNYLKNNKSDDGILDFINKSDKTNEFKETMTNIILHMKNTTTFDESNDKMLGLTNLYTDTVLSRVESYFNENSILL
jgi:adenylosuccinate lyase